MYMDMGDGIAGKWDGPILIIEGPCFLIAVYVYLLRDEMFSLLWLHCFIYMGYKKRDWRDQAWDGVIPGEVSLVLFRHFFLYFAN